MSNKLHRNQVFKKRGIRMAENKNNNEVNQNNETQNNRTTPPVENTNTGTEQNGNPIPQAPAMTKKEGFFVKHGEQLDKAAGAIAKGICIAVGAAGMFILGEMFARGKQEETPLEEHSRQEPYGYGPVNSRPSYGPEEMSDDVSSVE